MFDWLTVAILIATDTVTQAAITVAAVIAVSWLP